MKGFIVYSDYETKENKTEILLYGRLENGQSFVVIKDFFPYFFVREKDLIKIKEIIKEHNVKVEKALDKNFKEENVVKLVFSDYEKQNKFLKEVQELKIESYEADLKPNTRFLIDNDIYRVIEIESDFKISQEQKVDRVFINPEIKPASEKIKLKILVLDCEFSEKGELLCIGLYSKNYKKSFLISEKKVENAVSCRNVIECLEKFKKELIDFDPDIISGWNVIDFDFLYLKELFKKNKIEFDIGRNNKEAKLKIEKNFFKKSKIDVPGRIVLDGLNMFKDPFIQEAPSIKSIKTNSYSLEDVSQSVLGKGKLIKSKKRCKEIEELYEKNPSKLIEYNMLDCILVYEILEKTKMIDLFIERSELTGMQIDKVNASIASFDSLYIREARKRKLVSPTTKYINKEEKIKGGFVLSPKPGLYKNVLVLDFKSLYPSIIRTFNIDPASFIEKKEKDCIVSPNNAFFKNQEGILPMILERLHQAREKAKKEKREFSSYAIKIIMNSFFGVLASPNCRYFDLRIANAITHFGQEIIKLTTKKIEEKGLEVIYGDTDSIFINTKLEKKEAEELGFKIQKEINSFYEEYIQKNYKRKSYLEIEFEKLYTSFLMTSLRSKEEERGAKKRYAGLIEKDEKEILEIVGLEAIRGDWTDAAKEFQKELLLKIFKNEEISNFIKNFIKKLKNSELDEKLVYKKSIRKDLDEYTKTTPPHVKAARQLDELDTNVIEYYITTEGPEPIQKLKHKIDYEHYIEKQIKPIAKTILETLSIPIEKVFGETSQKKLF